MSLNDYPTKGNLQKNKKVLKLAHTGYGLLDKKRSILIHEMLALIDKANDIQEKIDLTYSQAYLALQKANITLGIVNEIAKSVPIEQDVSIEYKSVMGVDIPSVSIKEKGIAPSYGFNATDSALDKAYSKFDNVKKLTIKLAEIENSIYRLAIAIKKTQKRTNALKNVVIPNLTKSVNYINSYLEEKDREDFSRLKVIKKQKYNVK